MNETEESLKNNLKEIESQLRELAYLTPLSEELKKLKTDLEELYSLREKQLLELKKSSLLNVVQKIEEKDAAQEEEEMSDSLNASLIGQYCAVPHWSVSGIMHIQNAVICGVDPARGGVRVLIAAPTHPCDLPCPKFLNDDEDVDEVCGLKGASCRRSHGRFVAADQLGEYHPPDWSTVEQGDHCLVKLEGRQLWVHAILEGVEEDGSATVCLRNATDADGRKMTNVTLDKILPLKIDSENEESSSDGEDEDEDQDDDISLRSVALASVPWEAHSRGVASRIMAAMGYRPGQGLGIRGQGIADPVSIEVLPPGVSLDRVMQLRERRRARELAKAAKVASGSTSGTTTKKKGVFNFLNSALSTSAPPAPSNVPESDQIASISISPKLLSNSSQQEIGKLLLDKEKEVGMLERRVSQLKSTLSRAASHLATRAELSRSEKDLEKAKGELRLIERYKKETRDKRKLRIF